MKKIVIIGAGGFAREVLDVIDANNNIEEQYEMLGYIVDPEFGDKGTIINGKPILGGFDWLKNNVEGVYTICGVGPSHLRYQLIQRADNIGAQYFSVIHPTATLTRWVEIGEGVVITAGCILTNQIKIGNHVHLNLDCTIGHDVQLADFVTLAPGVHISGNVTLGIGCYIGTGANINEKLMIGDWSIIGAGSAVIGNIPSNSTAVGIPGKVIKEREQGWHLK